MGGLSDVVGALAKEMSDGGHDVAVFLPKYGSIDEGEHGLTAVTDVGSLAVRMGDGDERIDIYRGTFPGGNGAQVFFIGHDGYFGRAGIYGDPDTGKGYKDEVERYALFSRALLEAARALNLRPEAIHLNDHHTALAAAYLRELCDGVEDLGKPGIVFSIHNLGYQGRFDKSILPRIGFPEELCTPGSPFEFYGKVNSMKLGIEFADFVNTVSERYAVEISSTAEYGHGLEGVLAAKRADGRLVGILNGVDYSVWSPETDETIPARYSAEDPRGKEKCKAALVKRCRLKRGAKIPLIGMVSRLADQKGFDLVREAADSIMALGANLVVLGTGQKEYHVFLEHLAKRHPGRVSSNLRFDNTLAHWIEAGADMFLMPSRYEPCGLNQMYSLRYGTVPVVRATGGLADTVVDYDPAEGSGTGFVFEEYTSKAMLGAIRRAVDAYRDRTAWAKLVRRCMGVDFSWRTSAARYAQLYGDARKAALGS